MLREEGKKGSIYISGGKFEKLGLINYTKSVAHCSTETI